MIKTHTHTRLVIERNDSPKSVPIQASDERNGIHDFNGIWLEWIPIRNLSIQRQGGGYDGVKSIRGKHTSVVH